MLKAIIGSISLNCSETKKPITRQKIRAEPYFRSFVNKSIKPAFCSVSRFFKALSPNKRAIYTTIKNRLDKR